MRRLLAPLICLLAVSGCASRSEQQVHRLHAWSIPRSAFIPKVAAAPKPKAVAKAKAKAKAPAIPPASHGQTVQVAPGAPSDAEVRAELRQLYGSSAGSDPADARTVALSSGLAAAPPDAPAKVQAIVAAANQVAKLPYVYGGGHGGGTEGVWVDNAYDCSGSVSFALANAGLLKSPEASGALEHFGKPGPGRWVTIYANAGHAFMEVGGARFDTVGLKQSGSRWQPAYRSVSGFTVRHPPGL
jgi:cell wall-associated NlpC family hydrolase